MMTEYQGNLAKMQVEMNDQGVASYRLPIGESRVDMNALVGQSVSVVYNNTIHCGHCGRLTKKSFNQGYCYPCLMKLAQCDTCIIKPELCHYHEGTCREPEWGETHCLSDHFVYLSNTGTTKVGITRHVTDGVSSRWIDQGATQAIVVMRVPDRLTSGEVETIFKGHIGDKTNWRTMLKGQIDTIDMAELRDILFEKVAADLDELANKKGLQAFTKVDTPALTIDYPVDTYPIKIKSINLDKTPAFSGTLTGIKGQYWMLDGDRVINIRKYAGYDVTLSVQSQ